MAKKKTTKVKTRQRLMVRVRGTTPMVVVRAGLGSAGQSVSDLRRGPAGTGIAAVAVAEHFAGGEPVLEVAPLGPAILDPQHVGRVLNLRFGRLGNRGGGAFHGGPQVRMN